MINDKVKIEIDLLRDSLRNIFVVMFAIMSGEISLIYKILHNSYNYADFIKKYKKNEIVKLLERLKG